MSDLLDNYIKRLENQVKSLNSQLAILESPVLLERLAALEHNERWAGWERYRATKAGQTRPSGETFEDSWRRLRETLYADLTERERESDRIEVRKTLAVIREMMEAAR